MARITVEDCLEQIDNRFDLVLVAARRARQIKLGAESELDADNDKPTVLALREVAAGTVGRDVFQEPLMPPEKEEALDPEELHRQAAEMEPADVAEDPEDEEFDEDDFDQEEPEPGKDAGPAPFEDSDAGAEPQEEPDAPSA